MQQTNNNHQLFYIYDEKGSVIGTKDRCSVHHDGDWHKGVQLNLINNDMLLMQKRSNYVDISKELFDQTLATQLITSDKGSEIAALKRGLNDELNIDIQTLNIKHVAGPTKIIKRYDYNLSLYNREFVSLYTANFPHQNITTTNPKIASLFWMPINAVKVKAKKYPELFTKTFLMWLKEAM